MTTSCKGNSLLDDSASDDSCRPPSRAAVTAEPSPSRAGSLSLSVIGMGLAMIAALSALLAKPAPAAPHVSSHSVPCVTLGGQVLSLNPSFTVCPPTP